MPTVSTSNVRFWHELKEGSGTSVADEKGGSAGTLLASPTWTTTGPTGISTNCVNFAAAIDQKRIDTVGTQPAQVAFAASGWFFKAAGSQNGALFNGQGTTSGHHVFQIFIDSSGNVMGRVTQPSVGNDFSITSAGTDYRDSAWHHVLLQRDSSGNAELFVDNVSKGTATNSTALTSETCIIGNAYDADSLTDFNLGGKASQCILFDTPLGSGDRSSLYAAGAGITYTNFFTAAGGAARRFLTTLGVS